MYCQYKFAKYKQKKDKNNLYKIKYNYYNNMVGGFYSVPFQYVEALDSFINNYNQQALEFNKTLSKDQQENKKK